MKWQARKLDRLAQATQQRQQAKGREPKPEARDPLALDRPYVDHFTIQGTTTGRGFANRQLWPDQRAFVRYCETDDIAELLAEKHLYKEPSIRAYHASLRAELDAVRKATRATSLVECDLGKLELRIASTMPPELRDELFKGKPQRGNDVASWEDVASLRANRCKGCDADLRFTQCFCDRDGDGKPRD